jgi:hypothetical protein
MVSVEVRTTRLRLRDFELGDSKLCAFATDLAVVNYVEWGLGMVPTRRRDVLREEDDADRGWSPVLMVGTEDQQLCI